MTSIFVALIVKSSAPRRNVNLCYVTVIMNSIARGLKNSKSADSLRLNQYIRNKFFPQFKAEIDPKGLWITITLRSNGKLRTFLRGTVKQSIDHLKKATGEDNVWLRKTGKINPFLMQLL